MNMEISMRILKGFQRQLEGISFFRFNHIDMASSRLYLRIENSISFYFHPYAQPVRHTNIKRNSQI